MKLLSRVIVGPRIIPLAALFVGLAPLSTDVNLPLLPQVAGTFGVGDATAATAISVAFFGLAVGQLIAGPLSDQRGPPGWHLDFRISAGSFAIVRFHERPTPSP